MYWSRTGSIVDLITWLLLCSGWVAGGWLLCTHSFRLRSRERLFSGAASGLLLFILLSNLLAHVIPLVIAYWAAAALILMLGLFAAWRSPLHPKFPLKDLAIWPQIVAFITLLVLYTLINRGLGILDDYANLPLVSVIAAGDIPPHFYLNPDVLMDYHYGLHLFSASLVRIGGFYPWSAFDFGKALSIALAAVLVWLWYRRFLNKNAILLVGALLLLLAGGSRWLLLFIPQETMAEMSKSLQMLGSAAQSAPDLSTALANAWKIEGDGPLPFAFAFSNGIFSPLSMMASGGAMAKLTLVLLLLLARRRWRPLPGLIYSFLLASLALTAELYFVLIWAGLLLAALIWLCIHRSASQILHWGWVMVPSPILALVMGGVITTTSSRWLAQLLGQTTGNAVATAELSLRWPPAIISAHLGALSLIQPSQLFIALVEMGPALLLAPWMTWVSREYIRSRKLFMAALSFMAVLAFVLPIFIRFVERERDFSRATEAALITWLLLGFPYAWFAYRKSGKVLRSFIIACLVVTLFGGIALLPPQIVAIARPQPSYYIDEPDALISKAFWDKLEQGAWVMDLTYPYRPPALFGRSAGRAYRSIYVPLEEFEALLADPDPGAMAEAGYAYLYLDKESWQNLTPEQRHAFQQPCVQLVAEQRTALNDFRRLLDVRKCQRTP